MRFNQIQMDDHNGKLKTFPFSYTKKLSSPSSLFNHISLPNTLPPIDMAFQLLARRNGFSAIYNSFANLMTCHPLFSKSILDQRSRYSEIIKDQDSPLDLSAKRFKAQIQYDLAMQLISKNDFARRFLPHNPFEQNSKTIANVPLFLPPVLQNHPLQFIRSIQQQQQQQHALNQQSQHSILSPNLSNSDATIFRGKSSRIAGSLATTKSSRRTNGGGKQPVTSCLQCSTSFASLIDLNTHFLNQHEMCLIKELELAKSWKSHAVEEICMQELEAVMKQGDIETSGYQCPHCEYFAKWPTELQKHIMVHSKERPHQCIICGLTYKWKWDLGRHFDKSHLPAINPYKKNPNGTTNSDKRAELHTFCSASVTSPTRHSVQSMCSPNYSRLSSDTTIRKRKLVVTEDIQRTGVVVNSSNSNPQTPSEYSFNTSDQKQRENADGRLLSLSDFAIN